MFDTKIKILTRKTSQSSIISNLLLPQTHVKLKNSNFFQVFIQIFEMHVIRKMDSVTSTKREKISWYILLSCSNMNVLSFTPGSSNPLL